MRLARAEGESALHVKVVALVAGVAVLLAALPAFAQTGCAVEVIDPDEFDVVTETRVSAAQGDAAAQNALGFRYKWGVGVPQDDGEAVCWFRLAAAQGDAEAQNALGVMYAEGAGVPQDDAEAVRWFRLAAEQGDAEAHRLLGHMYAAGRGVPQDDVSAHMWFRLAAVQFTGPLRWWIAELLDGIAERMTQADLDEAQRRLRERWSLAWVQNPTFGEPPGEFGDDSGRWANDGKCDDPRFRERRVVPDGGDHGSSAAATADHIRRDATDCFTLFNEGQLTLMVTPPPPPPPVPPFTGLGRWNAGRGCEIPDYPTPAPGSLLTQGLSWCPASVAFQWRAVALQVEGAACAVAIGLSSTPTEISARRQEITAACGWLETFTPATNATPLQSPTCQCPAFDFRDFEP